MAANCTNSGRPLQVPRRILSTENYLLANAPKVEIGEPKELVKERIIRFG